MMLSFFTSQPATSMVACLVSWQINVVVQSSLKSVLPPEGHRKDRGHPPVADKEMASYYSNVEPGALARNVAPVWSFFRKCPRRASL